MKKALANYAFQNNLYIDVKPVDASKAPVAPFDFTFENHCHEFSELVIITEGSGKQIIDQEEYLVHQGDVFVLEGGTEHYFPQYTQMKLINIQFDSRQLPLPFDYLRRISGYNVIFHLEPSIRSKQNFTHHLHLDLPALAQLQLITAKLQKELQHQVEGFETTAFCRLLEIIVFVSCQYHAQKKTDPNLLLRLGTAISNIEKNFARKWTLPQMAAIVHLSPHHFLRLFKKTTSQTPIDYLLSIRLRHAAKMLQDTRTPISEIAADCGFPDSNYFSKQFHSRYGISPREYRHSSLFPN